MKKPVPLVRRAWLLVLALTLTGCSTHPLAPDYMATGSIRLPADPGLVGLVVVRPEAEVFLDGPHHRLEAAGLEATEAVKAVAHSEYALLFPAAYVEGGVYGVLAGIGEDDLKSATKSLLTVCREVDFDGKVVQSVRDRINAAQPGRLRELADDLPPGADRIEGRVGRESGHINGNNPTPQSLRRPNVNTVIRVRIVFRGFQVYEDPDPPLSSGSIFHVLRQKHNPPLCLVMTVDVTATRVRDQASLGGVTITYSSQPRSFLEWAAQDARPFRQEMEAGLQLILRQLGTRLDFGLPTSS